MEEGGEKSARESSLLVSAFIECIIKRPLDQIWRLLILRALIRGWMHTEYLMVLKLWKVFKAVGKRISAISPC